jgi:hypothetical protein
VGAGRVKVIEALGTSCIAGEAGGNMVSTSLYV